MLLDVVTAHIFSVKSDCDFLQTTLYRSLINEHTTWVALRTRALISIHRALLCNINNRVAKTASEAAPGSGGRSWDFFTPTRPTVKCVQLTLCADEGIPLAVAVHPIGVDINGHLFLCLRCLSTRSCSRRCWRNRRSGLACGVLVRAQLHPTVLQASNVHIAVLWRIPRVSTTSGRL